MYDIDDVSARAVNCEVVGAMYSRLGCEEPIVIVVDRVLIGKTAWPPEICELLIEVSAGLDDIALL